MSDVSVVYQTVCRACKCKITLDLHEKTAKCRKFNETWTTVLSVTRKRDKKGDRWGLVEKTTWLCPFCGKPHGDTLWLPDDQMSLPGFGL